MKHSAREATKVYHTQLYTRRTLFEKGASWLEKPEEEILSVVKKNFLGKKNIKVLDLGSGVGRNAIPIAKSIGKSGGEVICVDYLDVAIDKLNKYAKQYAVNKCIKGIVSPIESFVINPNTYDFIIAHSVLTHAESKEKMIKIIKNMVNGTRNNGINYIYDITNLKEFDAETGESRSPDAEVKITSEEFKSLLKKIYNDWTIQLIEKNPYEERFEKDGRKVIWRTDYMRFVAKVEKF